MEGLVIYYFKFIEAIDAHTFFETLTPSEFASVVRYKDTGELAIVWNNLGLNVPLKEFMEV